MHRIALAFVVVGLLFGPGALLAAAALPASLRRWWIVVPIAPVMSLGASFSVGMVLDAVGFAVEPLSVLAIVVVIGVIGVAARRLRPPSIAKVDRREIVDAVALFAIGCVSVYAWVQARGGHQLLPNYDAINHGLFVRRILEEGTLDPSRIVVRDPFTELTASDYYPLALHLVAAQVVRLVSATIPTALFTVMALTASLAWPAGMYAIARRLLPWRWAPVITAALAATMLQFPYKPISWGGLTTIVGVSLVPGVVALGLFVLRDSDRRGLPVYAFACGSLFVTHTSQVPAVLLFTLTLGAPELFRRATLRLLEVRTIAVSVVAALIPMWGVIGDFLAGSEERPNLPTFFGSLASFFGPLLTLSMNVPRETVLPVLFVLGGIAVSFALRVARRVVVTYIVVAALTLSAGIDEWWTSPFRFLTSAWYAQFERVAYYLVVPVTLLGAMALCGLGELLGRARLPNTRVARAWAVATTATITIVIAAIVVGDTRNFIGAAERDFAYWQKIDENMLNVADLTQLGPDDEPVQILATPDSGAMWLYVADPRLEPVGPFLADSGTHEELYELIGRLSAAGTDPWVDEQLDRYSIDYVFVNDMGMNAEPSLPHADELRANPCFTPVYESGNTGLWAVC
jgi:Family of unknown function (DUF6541)